MKRTYVVAALSALGGLVLGISLAVGSVPLGLGQLAAAFREAGPAREIVLFIRLPRILLAGAVGALLASAGTVLQGFLRNPLADPYLLGLSGGAALGSAIAFLLGVSQPAPFAVLGALAALGAVLVLARGGGPASATLMVLAGAALHAFTSSVLTFLLSQARREEGVGIWFWLLGSLETPHYARLVPLLILSATAIGGLIWISPALNLLALGEESAGSLGLALRRTRWQLILLSAYATGLAVTFNGVIPFVGLMVPHAARLLFGFDHRVNVPAAAFLGALLVVAADAVGRSVLAPQEIPVGVVTALLGAPFFLLVLRRERRKLG